MFTIGNKIIDDRIPFIRFSCDLEKCKGACCTIKGGKGAPLMDHEVIDIQNSLNIISKYLPEKSLNIIKQNACIEGHSGNFTTSCVEDKDCVFVFYENNIAKCAFEKAYLNNEINFRKPISCHLFPIRISYFGGDVLRYEKFTECKVALIKGKEDNVPLHVFLKDALIRMYGEAWYEQFQKVCDMYMKKVKIIV